MGILSSQILSFIDNDLNNSAREEPIAKQDKTPKSRFIDGQFKSYRDHIKGSP